MKKTSINEDRLELLEKRISRIESIIYKKGYSSDRSTKIEETESILIEQIDEIPIQHLVVISLKWKSKQSRAEIKQMLEDWGKVVGVWFKGGNLHNRLVKKAIIKRDGKNEKNEDLFSLTKKGELLAGELVNKIKAKSMH